MGWLRTGERLAAMVSGTLARLGLFYAAALTVAVLALTAFARLTEDVLDADLRALNHAVTSAMHAEAHPVLDLVALVLSATGGVVGTLTVSAFVTVFFLARKRIPDASAFLLMIGGASALVVGLKRIFRQPRPDLFESIAPETSFSYPSGHSLLSVSLASYLAALLVLHNPKRPWRWCAAALLGLYSLGVMWSRVYLGVHWLSDVTAGALAAMFWVSMCLMLRQRRLSRST